MPSWQASIPGNSDDVTLGFAWVVGPDSSLAGFVVVALSLQHTA